ncbi:hypothetical protein A4A49_39362 [Nicotiana attenuata]|uniref:Uncharacterized protein n=1 Tax=Nicotiana attenuata TaxID=49451 RepID=A0A1J6JXG4_NICAT|nr:hypothetical protein A4A49_39362 [Nicotiana attenuata]
MESDMEYHHPCSVGGLLIRQQVSPINNDRSNNNTISPSSLAIQFHLNTDEQFWYRPAPHEPGLFQGERRHIKSLRDLTLPPFVYMSYDMFYSGMQSNLNNWGEEFDRNYRHVVIRDMIGKVREIVDDESNKGRRILKVFVSLTLVIDHYSDERSLLEGLSPRFNGMLPARKSSIMNGDR